MSRAARNGSEPPGDAAVAGDDALPDIPLTVAAVAARLGVAPSTLRTWDRRYGLGPSGRTAGSHRRYTPEDVARLETMRRLTLAGAAPSDAARAAGPRSVGTGFLAATGSTTPVVVDDISLAAAAVEGADHRLRSMLAVAVRARGVMETWVEVAEPAFALLAAREAGARPGRDPEIMLAAAVLAAARDVVDGAGHDQQDLHEAARCAIAVDGARLSDRVEAQVLAAALAGYGVASRVFAGPDDAGALLRALDAPAPRVLCILGNPPGADLLARTAGERGRPTVVLVGPGSPEVWLSGVLRVRTLPASVHEIADLLDEHVDVADLDPGADPGPDGPVSLPSNAPS